MDLMSRLFSPYELNSGGANPLREILANCIDFDRVAKAPIKLFVTATNVHTGRGHVFRNSDITADVLLASACLPTMFQAIEIEGESYWDGGYSGNPTITPLVRECTSKDTILVQINPVERPDSPRTARRCPSCDRQNPDDAKFCDACGTALPRRCPACGAPNRTIAKFCNGCGAALSQETQLEVAPPQHNEGSQSADLAFALGNAVESQSVPEGERKMVTALFVDIMGSTELEQDIDPEEARAIIDPALGLMIDAVRRYDGYVVQSTGDGIFALFGAPVAREDHPQRTLYTAMRMQDEIRRYSARLRAEGRPPIQIRAGANTGEVVVRTIKTGSMHTEYTPIGHTVNLASRLQSLANAGSTVISDSTRKLVEGYFALRPLGPAHVKGISEPINVHEVVGLGPLRTRLQRSAGRGLSKFVGRAKEKEALSRAAARAHLGAGQIVAVVAEPGVGKSRLFFEFKGEVQSEWTVFEAFSVSHGKGSAYLPIVELLHGYFEITGEDSVPARREKVTAKVRALDPDLESGLPYLHALLEIAENNDRLAGMDAKLRTSRTLDAVTRLLLTESINRPLLLMVEDLHWLDDESHALLDRVADLISGSRMLLLVSYRPEYALRWGDKAWCSRLRLESLGEGSADEMLSAILGDTQALVQLKELIVKTTGGVPFFMEETVQALFDEGALKRQNGTVKLVRPLGSLKIPPTVQAILAARIDRLHNDEKNLLQTLAILGREFVLSLARAVAGRSEDELERLIARLQLGEFVYEQPSIVDVEYTFKHALTQEVAYNSVLLERRKQLHEHAGHAIETIYTASLDDHLAELVHHFSRSGNQIKAVEYLHLAGTQAMARGALPQAIRDYERTLALLTAFPSGAERDELELQNSRSSRHGLHRRARLRSPRGWPGLCSCARAKRTNWATTATVCCLLGQLCLACGPWRRLLYGLGPRGDRPCRALRGSGHLDGGTLSHGRDAVLPRRFRRRHRPI